MVFSTSIFLFFFLPLVIAGYHLLKQNYRIFFLMLSSLFFYAWGEPKFVIVLLVTIIVNYTFGILMHVNDGKDLIRKTLLFFSVLCNLGLLFYFKYLNFTLTSLNSFMGTAFDFREIVLPIGLSFFTFQGMSYVIDLYYKKVKVQKNLIFMAFYISLFPQLIAGPIVRYVNIEEQLYNRNESAEIIVSGIKRFVVGLAKKVIIANNLGYIADQVFANPAIENSVSTAWVGVLCYTFQIFFDFSGYSDMAIGLGRMFGFNFLENFNYPYISKSITEFWRRWHISLSSWFKDYLYIPLGGNRTGNLYVNLLIVFIATGFWHGASFNFVIWGLWHGLFLIVERKFRQNGDAARQIKLPGWAKWILTMLIVMVGWVFFRVEGLQEALNYLGVLFGIIQPENVVFTTAYYVNPNMIITIVIAVVASVPVLQFNRLKLLQKHEIYRKVTSVAALVLLFICILFVVSSSYNPFIYFRF